MNGNSTEDPPARHGDDTVRNRYMGVGIALGVGIGTALSVATDNWGLLGAGLAIGVALGVALGVSQPGPGGASDAAEREPGDPTP